jgi:uncharacterized protein YraI
MKFELPPPLPERRVSRLRQASDAQPEGPPAPGAPPTGRQNDTISLSVPPLQTEEGSSAVAPGFSVQKPKRFSTTQWVGGGIVAVSVIAVCLIIFGSWSRSARSPAGDSNVALLDNTKYSTAAPTPAYVADSTATATPTVSLIAPLPSLTARLPSPFVAPTPTSAVVMQASLAFHVIKVPAGDYLNVRAGPGDNYQVTGHLPPETDGVTIIGNSVTNGTTLWVPIVVAQIKGWVNRDYLASAGSQAQSSTAQGPNPPSSLDGEKYPQTRARLLSADDLRVMSIAELRYAINEVYARHGAAFSNNPDIRRQFQKFSWYHPNPNITISDIDQSMSEIEKENIKLLGQYRHGGHPARGAARSPTLFPKNVD